MIVRGITCKAEKGIFTLSFIRRVRRLTGHRHVVQTSGTNSGEMARSIFSDFAQLLQDETEGF